MNTRAVVRVTQTSNKVGNPFNRYYRVVVVAVKDGYHPKRVHTMGQNYVVICDMPRNFRGTGTDSQLTRAIRICRDIAANYNREMNVCQK